MLRLILRTDDAYMATHVGGSGVLTAFQTFDVDLPEVEAALTSGGSSVSAFYHVQLVGAEVIPLAQSTETEE